MTDAKNLAATGIRSPDRPARSESLHPLSYPGPQDNEKHILILKFGLGNERTRLLADYLINEQY